MLKWASLGRGEGGRKNNYAIALNVASSSCTPTGRVRVPYSSIAPTTYGALLQTKTSGLAAHTSDRS